MYWYKNINDLSYYTTPAGIDCYCAQINESSDLRLQGVMDYNGTLTSYSGSVLMYQPDGVTLIGGVTASFSFSYGKNPNGAHFFNAILNTIPSALCSNPCFVLKVEIKTGTIVYFSAFTDRYCAPDECCDIPSNILITQSGSIQPSPNIRPFNPVDNNPGITARGGMTDPVCGKPMVKLETFSDCFDNITGKYYKAINGKRYTNVFNIPARLKALPYEIQRNNSLNCRLQQSQIQRQYELEGFNLFSRDVMDDITASLTCQYIFINGTRYEIGTMTPFEVFPLQGQCATMYKLKATLQDCITKQIYGCGDICINNQQAFVQPITQQVGTGQYYDESKKLIANNVEELKNYYRTYPNVISVTDIDPVDYDCDFVTAFIVESDHYIPTSFYYNGTSVNDRIFGVPPETLNLCEQITPACAYPVLGAIINTEYICPTPVLGAIINTGATPESLYLTGYGNWGYVSDISTRVGNQVNLKFEVKNPDITYDSSDPDATIPNVSAIVAYISEAGWPSEVVNITKAQAPSLPLGAIVSIQPDGKIRYSGEVTAADLTGSTISITDIIYYV